MLALTQPYDFGLSRDSFFREAATFRDYSTVREENGGVSLYVELPGVSKEDVNISVDKGILAIEGEKVNYKSSGKSKFSRRFRLLDDIDVETISAKMEHGVLSISIPRKQGANRKVPVS